MIIGFYGDLVKLLVVQERSCGFGKTYEGLFENALYSMCMPVCLRMRACVYE